MAGKARKAKSSKQTRTRTTSSGRRVSRPSAKGTVPRISAAEPLWDLCRTYRAVRPILQALLEADVLNPEQEREFRLFMAMMDVLCGAARERRRARGKSKQAARRAN